MNEIDPCGTSLVSGPNAAALVIGRSLTRFAYHLSQAVLLSGGEFVPNGRISSWANANRVLDSMNARRIHLGLDRPDVIGSVLRECSDEINDSWFGAMCRDAVYWLNSEFNDDRDDDTERQDVVNQFATPWRERINNAIRSAIPPDGVRWFDLAQLLEEGLCRPDVYRFQAPFLNSRHMLRPDHLLTTYMESPDLSWESDDKANLPSRSATQTTLPRVAYVRRDPGDLVPHLLWWTNVESAWTAVGVDVSHLDQLRAFRKEKADRKTVRRRLIEHVEELFRAAHFAAGNGLERLRVDLKYDVVELDGTAYSVKKEVAYVIDGLTKNESFACVRTKHSDVFGQNDKLVRILASAPQAIQALIESGSGKRTRLLL